MELLHVNVNSGIGDDCVSSLINCLHLIDDLGLSGTRITDPEKNRIKAEIQKRGFSVCVACSTVPFGDASYPLR